MTKKYVYVPYSSDEDSFALEELAIQLRRNFQNEIPKQPARTKIHKINKPVALEGDEEVYILGYGTDSVGEISNIDDSKKNPSAKILSLSDIVLRLKLDGFDLRKVTKLHLNLCNNSTKIQETQQAMMKLLAREDSPCQVFSTSLSFETSMRPTSPSLGKSHKYAFMAPNTTQRSSRKKDDQGGPTGGDCSP